ncbi:MAG: hypothetical protein U0Q11_07760 [Vicinamibacterales bacterium]
MRFDEARTSEDLEMVRRRGHTLAGLAGKGFDCSGALSEKLKQFQATGAGRSLTDAGNLLEYGELERWSTTRSRHSYIIK